MQNRDRPFPLATILQKHITLTSVPTIFLTYTRYAYHSGNVHWDGLFPADECSRWALTEGIFSPGFLLTWIWPNNILPGGNLNAQPAPNPAGMVSTMELYLHRIFCRSIIPIFLLHLYHILYEENTVILLPDFYILHTLFLPAIKSPESFLGYPWDQDIHRTTGGELFSACCNQ